MFDQHLKNVEEATKNFPREFISVIPFSDDIISNEAVIGTDYIPYGSCRFVELSNKLKFKGTHFDLSKFNYVHAILNRDDMLNGDALISELVQIVAWLKNFPDNQEWFLRPSDDLKYFSGGVMTTIEAITFLEDAMHCESSGTYKLDMDTKIVLGHPKNIQMEWRYFIIGGKIISGSVYRSHGQLIPEMENDPEVLKEAQTFADKWLPDECVVMDLALADGELKVIEFNCINGSGFYDHDIPKIFESWWNYHSKEIL
jgi:hypothetical protein